MFTSKPILKPDGHQQAVQVHGAEDNAYHKFTDGTVDSLVGHRVDTVNSSVVFEVKHTDGSIMWKPESEIHKAAPDLVFAYWEKHGGRDRATGLTKYRVFKVLGLSSSGRTPASRGKKREKYYLVQWVGYSDSDADTTIEPEGKLHNISLLPLREFKEMNNPNMRKGSGKRRGLCKRTKVGVKR